MLTLKELKKIVKVADVEKRIPSVKSLKEHKVVVKEMINADTTISVYDHGYVLYTAGNQSTVFPLHSCDDYEYVSVTGDNKEFNKEFFDNENWYIRLLMEAEDRMAYSQSKISTNHGVFSNSDVNQIRMSVHGNRKESVDAFLDGRNHEKYHYFCCSSGSSGNIYSFVLSHCCRKSGREKTDRNHEKRGRTE